MEYPFIADQKVRVTSGPFRTKEGKITGWKVREYWYQFWYPKSIRYLVFLDQSWGSCWFKASSLESMDSEDYEEKEK